MNNELLLGPSIFWNGLLSGLIVGVIFAAGLVSDNVNKNRKLQVYKFCLEHNVNIDDCNIPEEVEE